MSQDFSDFGDEISELLNGVFGSENEAENEPLAEAEEEEIEDSERELILSKTDMSGITEKEYAVFKDYGRGYAVKIFASSSGKVPEFSVVNELVATAIADAITTYNCDIAKEKKSTFRTYFGWKIREAITTYFRQRARSSSNVIKKDEEGVEYDSSGEAFQADSFGNEIKEGAAYFERPDWEDTDRVEVERFRKLEWCMRQVRHELPRENNLILDVEIGEVTDFEGKKISLSQFAKLTGQPYGVVIRMKERTLNLIKQKMARKGYISLLLDDEKTVEDLHKETDIKKAIESFEESENIIASTDAQSIVESIEDELNSGADYSSIFGGEK